MSLFDPQTERTLIATTLTAPAVLKRVLVDERLRPEHFYWEQHAAAFDALVQIADSGETPSVIALIAKLEQAPAVADVKVLIGQITDEPPDVLGAAPAARRIRDLHRRRELKLAASLIEQAADSGDPDTLADAEQLLTAPDEAEPSTWTGQQLAERFADRLDEPAPERFSWPFAELDKWTGGGLRRKQIVLIGGWTSNGKSVLYDQILERLAGQGLRCHSYINEMSENERMDRTMARLSGVSFTRIYERELTPEQDITVRKALTSVRVGMTECAGWTAHEIARHIRWNRWDVAGVDILHEIAHRDERDLAEIAQVLRSTAKSVGCALIACVHLNDNRVTSPQRPVPVLRDVRGSGMLIRGADVVLMIHRDDDDDGMPTTEGVLLAAKIRNGQPNGMAIRFDASQMRFLPRAMEPAGTYVGGDW